MTTITIDRARLEELLGEYWEIAFEESSGVAATGNKANRVLHEIRALFDVKPLIRWTDYWPENARVPRIKHDHQTSV
jgi:hypothetical protein